MIGPDILGGSGLGRFGDRFKRTALAGRLGRPVLARPDWPSDLVSLYAIGIHQQLLKRHAFIRNTFGIARARASPSHAAGLRGAPFGAGAAARTEATSNCIFASCASRALDPRA